ncbi:MAG TPA: phosphoribosyl-ATP pyrophosphohydrolase [Caulobacteraceae bacterium]|jgi:NTP pyrophosphatase (non-canonical NTP hydrolase)|nr:phosphoribosyl-ATP pyrophosphohydrolase [Caulobacteraceae bacterium]
MTAPLETLGDRVQAVSDIYAERFAIRRDDDWALLKLQEELGELAQAHLRLSGRGRGAADEGARADEAADVLCMLLLYCRRHGIDLDAAVERKWLAHLATAPA